jgi:type IV pilus assembly protein PilA
MKQFHRKGLGFTLIELLIVIAIVAILAIIAVPVYLSYTKKAYFTEVINATAPYKLAVEQCYQAQGGSTGALANCNPGTNGVPANAGASGNVGSVTVASGVVTGTGGGTNGVTGVTIILTPTATNGVLIWSTSGTCQAQGLC